MKLIIGLGNPGAKYEKSRHNLGHLVVEQLANRLVTNANWKLEKKFKALVFRPKAVSVLIAKPQVFMNQSGLVVKNLINFYKIKPDDTLIVRDDIDMEIGKIRGPKKNTGSGGHKGVESIIVALGSKNFWQLKIGINRPGAGIEPELYVLKPFTNSQWQKIEPSIIKAKEQIEQWVSKK